MENEFEEIISKLEEINQKIDKIVNGGKHGKKLPHSPDSKNIPS